MKFTYDDYAIMIELLRKEGYSFGGYKEDYAEVKVCVLRHDVDNDLDVAFKFAEREKKLGVKSTYFMLIRSDFYNPFSKKNVELIHNIYSMGHDIGLHFDEKICESNSGTECINRIKDEIECMENLLDVPIRSVSMHRPSKKTLDEDYAIPGVINSYSKRFFKEFKYVSDSRRNWREDVNEIILSKQYPYLHILTHPIWYKENELGARETLLDFICKANRQRYMNLTEEFTNLEEFVKENDI